MGVFCVVMLVISTLAFIFECASDDGKVYNKYILLIWYTVNLAASIVSFYLK